jgi:[protein-PII] uridylyltransferase
MIDPAAAYKTELSEKRNRHFGSARRLQVPPLQTLYAYCHDVDEILRDIYKKNIDADKPDAAFCLIALGGYGRRELWPFSDVDILILHQDRHSSARLSRTVKGFWNIGLNMGCVVRTLSECAAIIGDDLATDTALLESRYICGNRDLFHKLQNTCLGPYFEKNKNKYITEISAALREGLYSSENSLYRVEPNIKNSICALRDCQRLLWAECVRSGVRKFAELHSKSGFSLGETRSFIANYEFLAGLRTELHLICSQRMDVLEMDYQNDIAQRFGFGRNGAGQLMEKYFKTVRKIRLALLTFLEKDLTGKSIWSNMRRRLSAVEIAPGIALLDGIVFSRYKKDVHLDTAETIISLFQSALSHRATLSVELRNTVRHAADAIDQDEFKTNIAGDIFLAILAQPCPVGQALLVMHETGVLGKLIPAFNVLTCKVEYDQYHEFTIDQHILLALCACDELEHDSDNKIRNIYQVIEDKLVLRLAVLLHDIGKMQPGDHAQNGAVIAENVCERLGLDEARTDQIRFLVYHHLDMANMSLFREPDDKNMKIFISDVENKKNLDLLYLLTVADIRSVGRKTWTGWKAYQLEQLYDRVVDSFDHLKPDQITGITSAPLAVADDSYSHDILPEDREKHILWLAQTGEAGLGLHLEMFTGFERLTVCADDRVGFLSDIIGCISSEGYNVLSARIYSTPNGKVLDIFHIEPPEKPRLTAQKRIANIYQKWEKIKTRQVSADDLVTERIKIYPPPPLRLAQQKNLVDVRLNNTDSPHYTIVEIDTADNFGLLHRIAHCFSENRVNIVSARLSTRNDQAVDVFYVTDSSGKKITGKDFMGRLTENLTAPLTSTVAVK